MTNPTAEPTGPGAAEAPAEPPEWTLARLAATADLVMTPCAVCGYAPQVLRGFRDDLGTTVAPRHARGCPATEPDLLDPTA